jgi:hypothetical protein
VTVTAALGWGSMALPIQVALRPAPIAAMSIGE